VDGTKRGLIEAGLSEPAGWRARLWGLCLRRSVRDLASGEARNDLGGLIAMSEDDGERQIRAGDVILAPMPANPVACRRGAASGNATIPADAIGARCRKSGAIGWPARHAVRPRTTGETVPQVAGRRA
jgi:hypothetical protein